MTNSATTTQKTGAPSTPTAVPAGKATTKKAAPQARKSTQDHKIEEKADAPKVGRRGSKSAMILGLIRGPAGASLAAIMKATGWQAHSVRGFLSTAPKRYDIMIESAKTETGQRIYRVAK